jgi:tRNA threonylcarbamoyladenosine biosynthesis protein TsaE
MSALTLSSRSVEDTRRIGAAVATVLEPGVVLLLVGGLGAGKTAFVQGVAEGLGVEGRVTSPTFTMVASYPTSAGRGIGTLLHADLYRVGSGAEADDLAIAELVEDGAVACVEWGDVAPEVVGKHRVQVRLVLGAGEDDRTIEIAEGVLDDDALRRALSAWLR